ncbi:glycosyltransferase family 4 protein [Bacillus sp. CECT 9360]|uniref:glycosyltransferase family 4 protein n=1 Tax=Bacillus sp. CECT 9360 TaxID=2845821 RepID=UPI001E5E7C53|nr:glycosyltransferase family 4 protein [Bacillus sp. CECT 9360]CAH0345483.1 D-inositol-3-phosphate glycosyltransferase [Bacillus sp. CECT 9360]
MKILLATYWFMPHVGGVNEYVNLLKKELELLGHEVDVLAHHPDMVDYYLVNGDKKEGKMKIKAIVYEKVNQFYQRFLPHVEPWVRWRDIERYTMELCAVLFDLDQYDLIHTQDIISTRALWRVKPKHVPLISTIHGLLANEHVIAEDIPGKDSVHWVYVSDEEFYGATSSDRTIVPTSWLHGELTKNFQVPSEHLGVIPYGMDIESFMKRYREPNEFEHMKKENSWLILCPARLVPVKGHKTLLHALHSLKNTRTDFVCLLAGDGDLRERLVTIVEELDLEAHVKFLGDRDDVPSLMRIADIMILPSLQDNLPFSIMEAQVVGLPVIASTAGGIPEMVIDGETGLLFEKEDSDALREQIVRLIGDRQLYQHLHDMEKRIGRKKWSSKALAVNTIKEYIKVLKGFQELPSSNEKKAGM